MSIPDLIREMLESGQYKSLRDMGRAIGISHAELSHLLHGNRGRRYLSAHVVLRLAAASSRSPEEILRMMPSATAP